MDIHYMYVSWEGERERETYKDGIPDKEDRCVVANKIPVAILCVELDSKPTRITDRVSATRLPT